MNQSTARPPVAVTMGEPAGIGGELALAAWAGRQRWGVPPFLVIDDPDRLARLARSLDWEVPLRPVDGPEDVPSSFPDALPVLPMPTPAPVTLGHPDPANSVAVMDSVKAATAFALEGRCAAVVTNPIQDDPAADTAESAPAGTDALAGLGGHDALPTIMFAGPDLRVVSVTRPQPLSDAIASLSVELIRHCAEVTWRALRRDFGVGAPRLSIAGLNPRTGDGQPGDREEREIIRPAIESLKAQGLAVDGPHPAASLFHPRARAGYDAAICMYYDQALIPLLTLDFDRRVSISLDLPIVRTSPNHGSALAIAGKGIASPSSFVEAVRLASRMARRRRAVPRASA